MLPEGTLILGGASSGKSSFAESLCVQSGLDRIYIATAQAFDDEMAAKIAAHRAARGPGWTTIEAPLDPMSALDGATPDQVVLLDCVTLWLSNCLLAGRDAELAGDDLLAALARCTARVVIVTNEVGHGIVPETKLGRLFRGAQGALNQRLADRADTVVAVLAGIPVTIKGTAP
ncbi:MAG: bifunctional adenosylcobinamide kinase/adenosylcobinamide-phosphate guanylyltransferase [Rhodobacteraceae bacterium]|nr:bifunctional adenosylcobinamide kinase/adenosylcobinamide-phosphate guanylyltransferase [Paracoccaceae bacterium]